MASEEQANPDVPPSPTDGAQAIVGPNPPPTSSAGPASLWSKIKRHKVVEWTLAYIAFAYVLLHTAEMLSEAQGWPHLIVLSLSWALILGVPIATTIAWYHGHKAQHRISGPEIAILTVLLFIAGSVVWYFARHQSEKAPERIASTGKVESPTAITSIPERSIAVLPFLDLSEHRDQEYFSDGLSEELIDLLTKIPDLRVPARTSSFYFKGKQATVPDIAKALSVANVLEGSVRKSGNRLRITAQLIRADNGYHLWSETYDRQLDDIFKVQDEIAGAVVQALKTTLTPQNQLATARRTISTEAYDQYLLGKQAYNQDKFAEAVASFRRAVSLDPNFSAGFAGLAEAEADLKDNVTGEREGLNRALIAANRAIELAPEQPEGYAVRSELRYTFFWDLSGGRADIERAINYDPNNSWVLARYGELLERVGQLPEAIAALRKAVAVDPLSGVMWRRLGERLLNARQYAEALETFNRAQELTNSTFTLPYIAEVEILQGHPEAASALNPLLREDGALIVTALSEWTRHNQTEAQRALDGLIARWARTDAYQVAEVYAWRGEADNAFKWLDRSVAQRDSGLQFLKSDPLLDSIRPDRRYAALLTRLGLSN